MSLTSSSANTLTNSSAAHLKQSEIFQRWFPLWLSWLFMAFELPMVTLFMTRLANPELNLAAFSGIAFPLSLIIEAPVIMLLSASTALSRDRDSYLRLKHFTIYLCVGLSLLHILCCIDPIYNFVVIKLLRVPTQIIELGQLGMICMIPWTAAIGFRRFYQGILIRFGRGRDISFGTVMRLIAGLLVCTVGFTLTECSGVVLGTLAVVAGVISESIYIGFKALPVAKRELLNFQTPDISSNTLTLSQFLHFYIPLAITPIITFATNPLISASLSRMPRALDSLAIWPVSFGIMFIIRSFGMAFHEVVISLYDKPSAACELRKFAFKLISWVALITALFCFTPLSVIWIEKVSGLPTYLLPLALYTTILSGIIPILAVLQNWRQGELVALRKTRAVTEATLAYIIILSIGLVFGIKLQHWPGAYVATCSVALGILAQYCWLRFRLKNSSKQRDHLREVLGSTV
jgi:hypothetical protein